MVLREEDAVTFASGTIRSIGDREAIAMLGVKAGLQT
jgi:hypothetical protein